MQLLDKSTWDAIASFLTWDKILAFLTILVTLTGFLLNNRTTVRIAKINLKNPKFMDIKYEQFDKVYFPIECLLPDKKISEIGDDNKIAEWLKAIHEIFQNNLKYSYPYSVKHCRELLSQWNNDSQTFVKSGKRAKSISSSQTPLQSFVDDCRRHCNMLRKELGYPSETLPFKYKGLRNKCLCFIAILMMAGIWLAQILFAFIVLMAVVLSTYNGSLMALIISWLILIILLEYAKHCYNELRKNC